MSLITSLMRICVRGANRQLLAHKTPVLKQVVRNLEVHEHIAHTLLKEACVPTPPFGVGKTPEEVFQIATDLKSKDLVLKAQVLAGGRGKGHFKGTQISGVMMCDTPEEAKKLASEMINKILITRQTGPAGKICNSVMVTRRLFPRKEYYIAVMLEQVFHGPVIIVSKYGGVDIEDIAAKDPDAIKYIPIDIKTGITPDLANEVADKLDLKGDAKETVSIVASHLYELFVKKEALLLEINPFVEDSYGDYYALDCKCRFDDSSFYRQKELFAFKDITQLDPNEVEAESHGLNYVTMDGNIGCMVNGAGLAMATMDIISVYGGWPANFLDVSGNATPETVREGFKILSRDPNVEAILVNIFGGIIRCDIIAQGIINAFKELHLKVPIVVRLQGTNVDQAKKMILDAKLKLFSVEEFTDAAEVAVKLASMMKIAKSLHLDISYTIETPKNEILKNLKKDCTT